MASFLDVCRFTATSSGTVDFVVSAAVTGYQTPAGAGAVNTAVYRYRAESADLSQWEVGYGPYTVAGTTLARTTVLFNSSGTTAKISFTAAPQVAVVALAEDLIFITPPQGRLTLQTGVPAMTTTQSAKTTIYYTPYVGNSIPIYDGTSFRNATFSELSVATTDTTKNPAAIGASKVNDWYIWDDAGTMRISHGVDWTSDTARNTSNTLTNGILLNTSAITNGPAASRGTYVGTTRSNGSSQLDWIYGASGTAAFFGLWNTYNRVNIGTLLNEGTANWTYSSTTPRALNATSIARVSMVRGLDEDSVQFFCQTFIDTVSGSNSAYFGLGLDSTSTFTSRMQAAGPATAGTGSYLWIGLPGLGFHFLQQLEAITNVGSYTAYGGNLLSAVTASLRA